VQRRRGGGLTGRDSHRTVPVGQVAVLQPVDAEVGVPLVAAGQPVTGDGDDREAARACRPADQPYGSAGCRAEQPKVVHIGQLR
jgi:hypothetical protein